MSRKQKTNRFRPDARVHPVDEVKHDGEQGRAAVVLANDHQTAGLQHAPICQTQNRDANTELVRNTKKHTGSKHKQPLPKWRKKN